MILKLTPCQQKHHSFTSLTHHNQFRLLLLIPLPLWDHLLVMNQVDPKRAMAMYLFLELMLALPPPFTTGGASYFAYAIAEATTRSDAPTGW